MFDVRPTGFRVLVEEIDNKQFGEIVLPDNSKIPGVFRHRIVAIGDPFVAQNGERIPVPFEVGQFIVFHPQFARSCGPAELHGGRKLYTVAVDAIEGVVTGEIDPPQAKLFVAKQNSAAKIAKAAASAHGKQLLS